MKSAPRPITTFHVMPAVFDPTRPRLLDLEGGIDITSAITDMTFSNEPPYTEEDFDQREVDEWNASVVMPVGAQSTVYSGSLTFSRVKPRWWEWRKRRAEKQAHEATHAIIRAMMVP